MPKEMTTAEYRAMMGLAASGSDTMTLDEYHALLGQAPAAMPAEMTLDEYHAWRKANPEASQEGRDYKAALEQQLRLAGLPEPAREVRFAAPRQWKFDYCWEAQRTALEYEGLSWADQDRKSGHTTLQGYTDNCEKYSMAAILGWCVVRITAPMVDNGLALALVRRALEREV